MRGSNSARQWWNYPSDEAFVEWSWTDAQVRLLNMRNKKTRNRGLPETHRGRWRTLLTYRDASRHLGQECHMMKPIALALVDLPDKVLDSALQTAVQGPGLSGRVR